MKFVPNKIFLVVTFVLFTEVIGVFAQNPRPPTPGVNAPPPPGLPIDNGLIVLFVAALIYGVYRTLKFSKN